jgi:hypothetical protein
MRFAAVSGFRKRRMFFADALANAQTRGHITTVISVVCHLTRYELNGAISVTAFSSEDAFAELYYSMSSLLLYILR